MNDNQESTQPTFLEVMEPEMRHEVIRLEQKLKGLQAELETRLDALEKFQDQTTEIQKIVLNEFNRKINQSLQDIEDFVNSVLTEELTPEEFLEINYEAIKEFRQLITENIEKINKVREHF